MAPRATLPPGPGRARPHATPPSPVSPTGREAAGLLPAARGKRKGTDTRSFIRNRLSFRPDGVTALSDEDIRKLAPSAFAGEAHESRSACPAHIGIKPFSRMPAITSAVGM